MGLSVEPLLPFGNQDFLRILEKDLYEKENTEDLILTFSKIGWRKEFPKFLNCPFIFSMAVQG